MPENMDKWKTPKSDSAAVDGRDSSSATSREDLPSRPRLPRSVYGAAAAALLLVAVLLGVGLRSVSDSAGNSPPSQPDRATLPEEVEQPIPAVPRSGPEPYVARAAEPHTEAAGVRRDVITYTVQAGDYLFSIAEKFGIAPETVLWANFNVLKDNPELIYPGQVLFILPVDGVYYQWQAGDRLDTVAGQFGVTPEDIVLWPGNDLSPTIDVQNPAIPAGTWLIVPGGRREFKQWEIPVIRRTDNSKWSIGGEGACQGPFSGPAGTGVWVWPTASHWVCGNDYTEYHHGIDLYITMGEPIHAADRGVVVYAGWNTWGYGNLVVVDHGNDWQTVYAHLDEVDVFCGAIVERGGTVGLGGTTGNSTGPHLHFEMIFSGVRVNPHEYLP
jgi:murein DD-endopeptidase MepM/ murein hydrolase activator NlpD